MPVWFVNTVKDRHLLHTKTHNRLHLARLDALGRPGEWAIIRQSDPKSPFAPPEENRVVEASSDSAAQLAAECLGIA